MITSGEIIYDYLRRKRGWVMEYEIVYLPKEEWKGTILPMGYTTDTYYDGVTKA